MMISRKNSPVLVRLFYVTGAALICLLVLHPMKLFRSETPSSTMDVKREQAAPEQPNSKTIALSTVKVENEKSAPDQQTSSVIKTPHERLEYVLKTKEFQEVLNQKRSADDVIHQLTDRGNASHPPQLKSYAVDKMRTPQSQAVVKGNKPVIPTARGLNNYHL